jgi:hypothetical protein
MSLHQRCTNTKCFLIHAGRYYRSCRYLSIVKEFFEILNTCAMQNARDLDAGIIGANAIENCVAIFAERSCERQLNGRSALTDRPHSGRTR